MDQRKAFTTLFDKGFDFNFYTARSERHQARMEKSHQATAEYLEMIDDERITQANHPLKVLVIAENWCGDCGNGVPVISKLAEHMDTWDLRIVGRDDFEQIVEQYYTTAGRKKIPVVIFADKDGDEIIRWVERPTRSYQILAELLAKKLPKEEYIQQYNQHPELQPPQVSVNIVEELLQVAIRAATMNRILPKKS